MATSDVGTITSLWRYPVKSMMGEELNASLVTERGLLGDRAFALVDRETGKVVSAKEPRKWARMFEFRSAYVEPPGGNGLPPVRIALPDGAIVTSDLPNVNEILSRELGREVALAASAPEAPSLEEYWPDIEGLAFREVVTDEAMPPGTFFDLAVVHVLATATIDRLRELYPDGRFEVCGASGRTSSSRPRGAVSSRTTGSGVRLCWATRCSSRLRAPARAAS